VGPLSRPLIGAHKRFVFLLFMLAVDFHFQICFSFLSQERKAVKMKGTSWCSWRADGLVLKTLMEAIVSWFSSPGSIEIRKWNEKRQVMAVKSLERDPPSSLLSFSFSYRQEKERAQFLFFKTSGQYSLSFKWKRKDKEVLNEKRNLRARSHFF